MTAPRRYRGAVTEMLLCVLIAPLTFGFDNPADLPLAAKERRFREATECRRVFEQLKLEPAQARRLVPIVEQAAELYTNEYDRQAERLADMAAAFAAFVAEDRVNQGFSPAVERRTSATNHRDKQAREAYHEQLIALEKEAAAVLTPQQREKIGVNGDGTPLSAEQRQRAGGKPTRGPRGQNQRNANEPPDRLKMLRGELQKLHGSVEPQPGPLARGLFRPATYEQLCQVAKVAPTEKLRQAREIYEQGTAEYPLAEVEAQRTQVEQHRKVINNWNLINGLYLSAGQINQVTDLYDGAQVSKAGFDELLRRPGEARKLYQLELAVERMLNPGQRQVIADYKACLVPPKNLKDPVRVGQASDHSAYEQWLTRNRKVTGTALDKAVETAMAKEEEYHPKLAPAERQKRVALLKQTARQAANMPDAEFEIGKAELAAKIAPPDRIMEVSKALDAAARERGVPGKLAKFMLNAEFIGQLRERGQQLAAGVEHKAADLASGPQAENCEKGCALPKKGEKVRK
jgi:hypothetical protein